MPVPNSVCFHSLPLMGLHGKELSEMNKRVFGPIQKKTVLLLIAAWSLLVCSGCTEENDNTSAEPPVIDRESKIPAGAVKVIPETDMYPPVLHSE